jgi:hypothetical protein
LGKAIHATADFNIDIVIVDEGGKSVFCHDGQWNDGYRNTHVFVVIHWGIQVEVLEITSHKASIGSRDDAV